MAGAAAEAACLSGQAAGTPRYFEVTQTEEKWDIHQEDSVEVKSCLSLPVTKDRD